MADFHSALYRIVGDRIRQFRIQLNLTQQDLSTKVAVLSNDGVPISRTSISNIEVGRHQPPLHLLSYISQALSTDITDLVPKNDEVMAYLNSEILNSDRNYHNLDLSVLLEQKDLEPHIRTSLKNAFKSL